MRLQYLSKRTCPPALKKISINYTKSKDGTSVSENSASNRFCNDVLFLLSWCCWVFVLISPKVFELLHGILFSFSHQIFAVNAHECTHSPLFKLPFGLFVHFGHLCPAFFTYTHDQWLGTSVPPRIFKPQSFISSFWPPFTQHTQSPPLSTPFLPSESSRAP